MKLSFALSSLLILFAGGCSEPIDEQVIEVENNKIYLECPLWENAKHESLGDVLNILDIEWEETPDYEDAPAHVEGDPFAYTEVVVSKFEQGHRWNLSSQPIEYELKRETREAYYTAKKFVIYYPKRETLTISREDLSFNWSQKPIKNIDDIRFCTMVDKEKAAGKRFILESFALLENERLLKEFKKEEEEGRKF